MNHCAFRSKYTNQKRCRYLCVWLLLVVGICSWQCKEEGEVKNSVSANSAAQAVNPPEPVKSEGSLPSFNDLASKVGARTEKVMSRPEVEKAMSSFFERLFAGEPMAQTGAQIMKTLGEDSTLAKAAEPLITRLSQSEQMQKFVIEIMAQNPKMNADEVGNLVGKKIEQVMASPAWSKGLDRAIERLFKEPALDKAFNHLVEAITAESDPEKGLSQIMEQHFKGSDLMAVLIRINGGKTPSLQEMNDLMLKHMFTEDRIASLLVQVFSQKSFENNLGRELGALTAKSDFSKQLGSRLSMILADQPLNNHLMNLFELLLKGKVGEDDVTRDLGKCFSRPVVANELAGLVNDLAADRQFMQRIRSSLFAAFQDPAFGQMLRDSLIKGL